MGLPTAVQAIGDAAEQQAIELGLKPGSKPATAEPAQPVKKVEKVDPENYEERYKRYKVTTDETIADQRKQISDLTNSLAQMQQQVTNLTQQLAAKATPAPATAEPSKVVTADPNDNEAAYKQWYDALPQRMKDDYTDEFLRDQFFFQSTSMGQQAAAAPADELNEIKTTVESLRQHQQKTEAQLYEEAMDEAYPNDAWINMTREPEWAAFCARQVSPVDQRSYGDIVKQGSETHTASTVIWVLQQYQQYKSDLGGQGSSSESADTSGMESLLTPEGGAGGDAIAEITAGADTYTQSQVTQFYNDMTKGKYSPEEFQAIEESIIRAQQAGKIIQG